MSLIVVSFLLATAPVHAALILNLEFADSEITVAPSDSIFIDAVLSNDAASTESFNGDAISGVGVASSEVDPYYFGMVFDTLSGVALAPGQSLTFSFARFDPIFATPDFGTYFISSISLQLRDSLGAPVDVQSTSPLTIHVVDPASLETPAPAAALLFLSALGIGGASWRRRR